MYLSGEDNHRWLANSDKSLLILLLSFTVIFIYGPALNGGFIFDDEGYVASNPLLRDAEGLLEIWINPKANSQYYPLTFTSFWIEYQLWQTWTMGYHLTNIVLHLFNTLLLLRLLESLAVPGAWFVAAIFAVHPVHVESVAWIAERKNVLSGLFYLLALSCYLRFSSLSPPEASVQVISRQRWRAYGAAFFFFGCALLSKSVTCSLPAVILLIFWWQKGKISPADCWPLVPMFIVGAIVSGLSAVLEWHPEGAGATGEQWQFSLVERSLIAGRALWFYLFTLLCPTNLIFIYPRWTIDLTIWYHYLFPTAALVSMVVLGRLHKRIGGAPLAATLFFTGTLLPTLGFLNFYFMCFSFVADHFLYLASIGPIALVGSLLWRTNSFVEKHGPKFSFLYVPLRNFSMHFLFTSLILAGLSTLTWRQAHLYANAETLWSYTIRQNPTSGWAYNNLAAVFSDRKEFSRALPYFEKAVALNPNEPFLHSNLALTFFRTGDFTRALEHGFLSVSLGPRTALSALYADRLGQILWHKGDLVQAGHYFHDAEQQQFANADIYYHLGILTLLEVPLLDLGGPQEGVVRLEKSLQLDLRRAMAAPTLAWVLATFPDPAIRDSRRAVAMAEEVCVRKSFHDADAIDTLGAAYAAAGRFAEAIRITQVAVKMANAEGRREFADRIRARLKLYQVGKPFYDTIKEKITF